MNEMKCMIVEDELPAVELLSKYLEEIPGWHLVKVCGNAMEAMEYLRSHPVDLLFLDIEMPQMNGIEMLQALNSPPLTIITSAYSEYGVKAYDVNVFDYLLKPYSFARLMKTYQRVAEHQSPARTQSEHGPRPTVTFKEKGLLIRVEVQDILFIESQRSYVLVRTTKQLIRSKMTLTSVEELLPANDFIRAHRSYLVAINKIQSFSAREVFIGEWRIPIGRNYKHAVSIHLNDGGTKL